MQNASARATERPHTDGAATPPARRTRPSRAHVEPPGAPAETPGAPAETPQPPADIIPGAVDRGNGRASFAIYAPGKQSVHLVGDFNGWDRSADPMHCTPAGLWWIEKDFPPGDHTYQFLVDGEVLISDPYARHLAEDAACDPPRAIVQVGHPPFAWAHDDWPRPQFHQLVLYELHVGDFTPEGTLEALTGRLDYLRDLGINALELMPIFEFRGDQGWGYDPAYLFAVEQAYGTPDQLKRLIDEAHARGIAIILDLVLAHTSSDHPFNKLYPYHESPWYGPGLGEQNQFGFPALDYGKGPAQAFARDIQAFWLQEFHVDGFRYDYLHGIGIQEGCGVPFLVESARAIRPDVYLIGEYSPEWPDAVKACGLDAIWHVSLSFALKALLYEGQFNGFDWNDFDRCIRAFDPGAQGYPSGRSMINYLVAHDEARVIHELLEAGADKPMAREKSALGALVLFTIPGEPMLYHGQEWGELAERRVNGRSPLHWELLEKPGPQALLEHYRRLCQLRHAHPALTGEGFAMDAAWPDQKCLVYHRWDESGDEVVVAINFSPVPQTIRIPLPRPGGWTEFLLNKQIDVEEAGEGEPISIEWQLEPTGAAVLVR